MPEFGVDISVADRISTVMVAADERVDRRFIDMAIRVDKAGSADDLASVELSNDVDE